MAKLMNLAVAVAAVLFLFLIVVDASIRTTVIIDDEEPNQGSGGQEQQQCEQEFQEHEMLRPCQNYLWDQVQRGGSGGSGGGQQGEHFERCCDQLRDMRAECSCRGLERVIGQMRQDIRQPGQQQESRRMIQKAVGIARDLPQQCRADPRQCEIPGQQQKPAWFF